MKTTKATLCIDIGDVRRAGGISQAIIAHCENSDDIISGVVGAEFSTSGPGPGWSQNHDANDFARRAFDGGALHYIDADDGKCISAEDANDAEADEDGELPEEAYRDIGGSLYRIGKWTEESVIELVCPSVDDALEYPDLASEMARAVIDTHGDRSDKGEWRQLIAAIKAAAEAFEDIDTNDMD